MSAKLLATIFLSFISIPVLAQRVTEDQFLVAPYLQFSTKTGMYILWETREAATSRIDFSEAMMKDKKPRLDQHVTLSGTRLMHELFLSNLKPETNYFWQATSVTAKGDTIRSGVYTFKTAVNDSSAYMFALVGDT
ncbi:MAG: fibronectin type III domain-containing protein, partial [Cyclobacteriaceae bacterium]